MARIRIAEENRQIDDTREIQEFLQPFGIWHQRWDVQGRIDRDANDQEILDAYAEEVETLKQRGGFVTADVINVNPQTPNLDAMLQKFSKEHTHSEDEVRFTVKGRGVFHIHPDNGPVFAIEVGSGDLINVPAGTRHWFDLCDDRMIRCIRLFQDTAGWAPQYVEDGVHEGYAPLCMGPTYLAAAEDIKPVVDLS